MPRPRSLSMRPTAVFLSSSESGTASHPHVPCLPFPSLSLTPLIHPGPTPTTGSVLWLDRFRMHATPQKLKAESWEWPRPPLTFPSWTQTWLAWSEERTQQKTRQRAEARCPGLGSSHAVLGIECWGESISPSLSCLFHIRWLSRQSKAEPGSQSSRELFGG